MWMSDSDSKAADSGATHFGGHGLFLASEFHGSPAYVRCFLGKARCVGGVIGIAAGETGGIE